MDKPKRLPIKTSREDIVDYWKNRIEINGSWDDALTHCWACGSKQYGVLERAHIIPHCLKGIDDACNLVLLCFLCNKECPETIYGYDFMLWLKSRVSKEEDYHLAENDPLAMQKEYKNMYEQEMFSDTIMRICNAYFGEYTIANCFNPYRGNQEYKTALLRYPSTTSVLYDKYINKIFKALEYIWHEGIDVKDKERMLKIFYEFTEIKPEQNISLEEQWRLRKGAKEAKKSYKSKPEPVNLKIVKREEKIIEYGPCLKPEPVKLKLKIIEYVPNK